MQKSKERMVSFFDIALSAHTYGQRMDLPPLPLLNFFDRIKSWHDAGKCPKMGRKSAEIVYLADLKISTDRKRAEFLVNRSDRDASDSVYSNPLGNTVRRIPKTSGEGNDFSAHVVVNLKPQGNKYMTVLELSPGLASGKIATFLNFLIGHCVKEDKDAHKVPHPNGATNSAGVPETIVAYHKVELTGHPSDQFLNSINGGVLESIELIDRRKNNLNWDTNGHMKEISRSVSLRVGPKANAPNFRRVKEAAAIAFQKNYSSARVRFKTPDGIMTTVTMDTQSAQLANDVIYVKKEKISGFSQLLETSYEALHPEIIAKMIRLL